MSNVFRKAYRRLGFQGLIIFISIFSIAIYIFKYRKFKAMPSVKEGFKDHRPGVATGDAGYMRIFKMLVHSYNKAKAEQEKIDQPYRVGYMWQTTLDAHFGDLVISLRDKDTVKLQALLENFDREWFSFGLGGATD